ncbi:MAG: C39 family peptidase [Chthoniobacter sp.]|nr:C39 family peptidase [Chthoniobacter sp.]
MLRPLCSGALAVLSCLAMSAAQAQDSPNVLEDALTRSATWTSPEFLAAWSSPPAGQTCVCRRYRGTAKIFGIQPQAVQGWFDNGKLTSITIIFLDSGAWFGYVPDAEAKTVAQTKGPAFMALYQQVSADVQRGLEQLAGNKGREVTLGLGLLKHPVHIYHHGDLASRLTLEQDQLVKVSIFPSEEIAGHLLSPERRALKKDQAAKAFVGEAHTLPDGDRVIETVPVIPQGDRAYCGVSTLAMVMRYLGVDLDTEDYAAAAGIHFGSTVRSKIKETYDAAGETAELHLPKTTKFDFAKAKLSLDAGLPVIVFRRWSQERDYLHTTFARNFAANPALELPKPDLNDQKLWPAKEGYAHASVVNGYNERRREVIFTESWGEQTRNRRMRIEELEGTSYLAYYPHF